MFHTVELVREFDEALGQQVAAFVADFLRHTSIVIQAERLTVHLVETAPA